jgi:hypothetical protein|nr:MAG TPA: hypothetical protein [Caudoviricetes sp.]
MAQVPKFETGGKSPSNIEEYNKRKQELQDLYNKKEQETKTITINGKKYDIKEAKEKLQNWVSSDDSRNLKNSYRRRGSGVDASYNRFLDALSKGDIQEINSTPSGFDIKYNNSEGFNLGDKYSSDYLAKAIDNNFLNLTEYSNTLQEPNKIDVSWNPRELINSVWGGKINQEVYNRKNTSERIDDVIRALENNRGRFYEYLSSEDKTPFKGYENLPFKSIQEYDQFIEDLSQGRNGDPNSEFDWEEQKNNQRFGDYIWKYIFGDSNQQNSSTQGSTKSEEQIKKEEDEIRKTNNLPEGAPLSYNFNGKNIVVTKEGLREIDSSGNLVGLRGYFPFESNPATYMLKSGWYDTDYIPYEKIKDYVGSNVKYLNDIYNPEVYSWRKNAENIKYKKDWNKEQSYNAYYKLAKLLNLPEGEEYGIDYFNPYIGDNQAVEDYEFIGINNPQNVESYLNTGRPYKSKSIYAINKKTGDIIPGEFKYNQGYLQFSPTSNYPGISSINLNKLNVNPVEGRDLTLGSKFLANLYSKYFNINSQYLGANEAKGETTAGGIPIRYQEGGILRNSISSDLQDKQSASMSDVFSGESLSAADKADLTALALDIAGLASTAAFGVGNAVGAATGLGSTISTAIADYKRDDDWSWSDTGNLILNLGMDAATLIPGLGTMAKGAKVTKAIKTAAPILRKAFTALGLGTSLTALGKVMSGEELTINDWRLLANGLNAVTGIGRNVAGKKLYTQKAGAGELSKPLEVNVNGKTKEISFKNNEVEGFNKMSTEDKLTTVKTKLKSQYTDLTDEDLSNIKIPKGKWYNPFTRGVGKVKETKVAGRELTPETLDKIKNNKLSSFQKGLVAEQAYYRRGNIQKQLENNNIYLGQISGAPTVVYHGPLTEKVPGKLTNVRAPRSEILEEKEKLIHRVVNPTKGANDATLNSTLLESMQSTPFGTTRPLVEPSGKATRVTKSDIRKADAKKFRESDEGKAIIAANKQKLEDARRRKQLAYLKGQETKRRNELGYKEENKNLSRIVTTPNESVSNQNDERILNLLIKAEEDAVLRKRINAQEYQAASKHSSKKKTVSKKKSKDVGDRLPKKHKDGGTLDYFFIRNKLLKERDKYELGSKEWIEANKNVKEFKNGGVIKYQDGGVTPTNILEEVVVTRKSPSRIRRIDSEVLNNNTFDFNLKPMNKPSLNTPITKSSTGSNIESQNYLPTKSSLGSIPLTTISSLASAIQKTAANNKIYKTLKKDLRPSLINLPTDLNYSIQGNEGVRQAYYKQAANLEGLTRTPLTSDADRQLAYNLEVAKNAAEARLQGDLANEQAIQQSREKAFQVNANNLIRREEAANRNRLATTEYLNTLANLKAQKIGQNANIWDTFLHDVTEQTKQYINTNNARKVNEQLLDSQYKNARLSTEDSITASDLQRRLDALYQKEEYKKDPTKLFLDPEYKNIINAQKELQLKGLKRSIDLQKLGLSGQYPKVFRFGGIIKK